MQPLYSGTNGILRGLPLQDQRLILPYLQTRQLPARHVLEKARLAIEDVLFIEEGIASVTAKAGPHIVEIGIIGREGHTGISLGFGVNRPVFDCFMQVPGRGQAIRAEDLTMVARKSPFLEGSLRKFSYVFGVQVSHSAVANARLSVIGRLARWLLMAHDRLDGDELRLTHEFLSYMLGVRRAGVTGAIHALQKRDLISAARTSIRVLNRTGLQKAALGIYGVPEAEYVRLL